MTEDKKMVEYVIKGLRDDFYWRMKKKHNIQIKRGYANGWKDEQLYNHYIIFIKNKHHCCCIIFELDKVFSPNVDDMSVGYDDPDFDRKAEKIFDCMVEWSKTHDCICEFLEGLNDNTPQNTN